MKFWPIRKRIILIIALLSALIFTGIFSYNAYRKASIIRRQALEARSASWAKLKEYISKATKGFKGDVAIVIKDFDMNWQIESNKDMPIPSASLVKIPIMMAYFYAAEE